MFLLLVPLAALLIWGRSSPRALQFSSTAVAGNLVASWRSRLAALPLLLRVLMLIALVIALARPQLGFERVRDVSRGIAIAMVVDRSSSMGANMKFGGSTVTRLEAVKSVFRDFIDPQDGEMKGRPNDLIGMTMFAQYADSVCPLTLSHDTLLQLLDTVQLVDDQREDGTAIGDALALAGARLKQTEEELNRSGNSRSDYEIKSKIIILLTDGENNAGDRSVSDSAQLCKQWGIRVYAVGVGDKYGIQTAYGRLNVPLRPGFDDKALRALAETTGGLYWLATDADALREVHSEIDALETSEFEAIRSIEYREMYMPWALAALAFLCCEILLRQTLLRTIP